MIQAVHQINWLAVLAATVAHFVLGAIWFGVLFSKQYANALGIADRPQQMPGLLFLIGPFVCGLFLVLTTALLLRALGITAYSDALMLGALVGIGYFSAMTLNIAINPIFPHPFLYTLINAPMFFIANLMSCAILTAIG